MEEENKEEKEEKEGEEELKENNENIEKKEEPNKKGKLTEKMRENPWVLSTLVLGIVTLILLIGNFSGGMTGGVISEREAGERMLDLANSQVEGEVELIEVEIKNGLYEVTLLMDEREVPIYLTMDGELFGSLTPLSLLKAQQSSQQEQESEDWSIFENEVPSDMKSKILSFVIEEPEEYDSSMGINEFKNYELIPKTLIVFYSSGCGWCGEYYPVLIEAMEKYPEITIYALTLSDDRDIGEKYGVTGTPANIINGKYFVSGYRSIEDLSEILDELN